MHPEIKKYLESRRKLIVLEYAKLCGNVVKACREFEVPRSSFYRWKRANDKDGMAGLVRSFSQTQLPC